LLALGIAAIATAGYLFFKGRAAAGKVCVADSESEQAREETEEPEELPNNFFLDPSATYAENERLIVKWMNDQIEAQNFSVVDRKLKNIEDF